MISGFVRARWILSPLCCRLPLGRKPFETNEVLCLKIRGGLLERLHRSLPEQLLGALDEASVGGYG